MAITSEAISVGILIFILIVIIIYVIVLFELYKNQQFIFAVYKAPSPPADQHAFYPLGSVRPLTQEEIDHKNMIIRLSTGTAT